MIQLHSQTLGRSLVTLRKGILLRFQNYVFTKVLINTEHRIKKIYYFLMYLFSKYILFLKCEIYLQINKIFRHSPCAAPPQSQSPNPTGGNVSGGNNKDE